MAKKKSFRQLLKRSLLMDKHEIELFDKIPDEMINNIFEKNFNGNINTAERVLFNKYSKVQQIETERLESEKLKIKNLSKAASLISNALKTERPVLFITDADNDGSLSQSVLIEFMKLLPADKKQLIHIEYAQPIGAAHGITYEIIEKSTEFRKWDNDKDFLIVTADNGINNREEQEKIMKRWNNAKLIVSDHHLPSETVVHDDDRSIIVNPKYEPTDYFKKKNISGANTLGVLLTQAFHRFTSEKVSDYTNEWKSAISNIREIGYWANLLDFAQSDIADMPTKPYTIERAVSLRPLLNTSTSMSTIITGKFDDEVLERIEKSTDGKINKTWLKNQIDDISVLNLLAHKLLNIYKEKNDKGYAEDDFYSILAKEISNEDVENSIYKSINPNFIEQLRPIIFDLAAIDEKDVFDAALADNMTQVFTTLRKKERILLDKLREVNIVEQDRLENSTILYPINEDIVKVFNRKILGKAYNQDNNGFLLTVGAISKNIVTGSMRTLYPIDDILVGKEELEEKLNINIYTRGHDKAAGYFIEAKDSNTKITFDIVKEMNAWINKRVAVIKENDIMNDMPTLEIDFASVGLITRINAAVKANLAGMYGIPAIVRFSPNEDKEVWITDSRTSEQFNLKEIVSKKTFGYQPIPTDLHGGAFIIPVELLRSVVEGGFEKGVALAYLNEGAFMAHQLVDVSKMPKLTKVMAEERNKEDLSNYYKETYKDSNFIPISREDFRNMPYFKYNRHGEKEFANWENLIITILDKSAQDVLAVIDTEGTGLGKAPKCFNIGGTNIKIDETSGSTIERSEFNKGYFKSSNGYEVLLDEEQINSLIELGEDENDADFNLKEVTILYKASLENGISSKRMIYPGNYKELNQVSNIKEIPGREMDQVLINRKINGFAFAYLIKDNDFAITKDFENLTGISQAMINELGITAKEVDEQLVAYYSSLKNINGDPAKIIFQAHNMPYDKGVISSNFQTFNQFMELNIISDTAKMARLDKLAYDDTPVCSFDGIEGLPPKVYFYDSPYSDYSMTTFLERIIAKNEGGVFPDITSKYLLRYNEETGVFSFIDRTKNDEFLLETNVQTLWDSPDEGGARESGQLPNNAVKYSVQRLSVRSMIRNILLNEELKIERLELNEDEKPFANILNFYQDNYYFDDTVVNNLQNFYKSMYNKDSAIVELFETIKMEEFTEKFLKLNKKIQAKFHDGWIYEKVLNQYEPSVKDLPIASDTLQQINYYTDLPNKKIKQVLQEVVHFKRAYNIEHALVHEQHNNIKQHSEDGLGLSDTAYESILPQHLGIYKFYNPYFHSVLEAANEMISKNMKGSMISNTLKNINDQNIARDSFSYKQMSAFRREHKTDIIKVIESINAGTHKDDNQSEEIKFKLKTDVLPIGSAVYAKTTHKLSAEQIEEVSEKLNFIMINEQVKEAAKRLSTLSEESKNNILKIVKASDTTSVEYKDEILSLFNDIQFSRREADFKKVAEIFKELLETGEIKISNRLKVNEYIIEASEFLSYEFSKIMDSLEPDSDVYPMLEQVPEILSSLLEEQIEDERIKKQKAEEKIEKDRIKRAKKGLPEPEVCEDKPEVNPVRQYNFLNEVDIQRREPLGFLLKHGIEYCLPYLKTVMVKHQEKITLEEMLPKSPSKSLKI